MSSNQAEEPAQSDDNPPRQLSRAPASPEDIHSHAGVNGSLEQRARQSEHPGSPPVRKDTNSSTSTNYTTTTLSTVRSSTREDTAATAYSAADSYRASDARVAAESPIIPAQAVFSVNDGTDVSPERRATRRRTGPLTDEQRRRAALIRKLGACNDCRKRRVACHPGHHNMTWEEATKKFTSPTLPPLSYERPISPATSNSRPVFTQDPQEMDVDTSPTQQAARSIPNESRIRTPLPSGPRPGQHLGTASLPGIDSFKPLDIQRRVSQLLADPHRNRYTRVSALLVHWQDDADQEARACMNEFATVLNQYNYTFQIKAIPSSSDGSKSSFRWLNREVQSFIDNDDQRNVLKVVYYIGYSYWDGKEMVLSSSKNSESASAMGWSAFQHLLSDATSDVLILMDSAYYPSLRLVKDKGVLELIAACASEDQFGELGRGAFTRALSRQLLARLDQKDQRRSSLSAAELHASLLSRYSDMIGHRSPVQQRVTSFPSPLHFQVSGTRLPSILLAPVPKGRSPSLAESPTSGGNSMNMTFRLSDEPIKTEEWVEWLRLMPEGVRDAVVRMEGPSRDTFR